MIRVCCFVQTWGVPPRRWSEWLDCGPYRLRSRGAEAMAWTRHGTSRRGRIAVVILSTVAMCAFVVGVSLLNGRPVTAAVCGDANPAPPDTGSGGPATCPQNPTGTDGYFVANINGNVYGIGNAFPFSGFGTLHHAANGTDQDPGATGADISTTGDGAGFYLLDTGGNVY